MNEPMMFRKKFSEVEALRWDGTNWGIVCEFLGVPHNGHGDEETMRQEPGRMPVIIHTLGGDMRAELGDWIVKDHTGQFSVGQSSWFDATYEPVNKGE